MANFPPKTKKDHSSPEIFCHPSIPISLNHHPSLLDLTKGALPCNWLSTFPYFIAAFHLPYSAVKQNL